MAHSLLLHGFGPHGGAIRQPTLGFYAGAGECTLDTIAVGDEGTAQADIADDWKFVDGVETVTLTDQNSPHVQTHCVRALAGNLTRREVAGLSATSLGVEPDDLAFTLWISTLNSRTPKRGDKITRDDGEKFTILSCQLSAIDTCWRCLCRKRIAT